MWSFTRTPSHNWRVVNQNGVQLTHKGPFIYTPLTWNSRFGRRQSFAKSHVSHLQKAYKPCARPSKHTRNIIIVYQQLLLYIGQKTPLVIHAIIHSYIHHLTIIVLIFLNKPAISAHRNQFKRWYFPTLEDTIPVFVGKYIVSDKRYSYRDVIMCHSCVLTPCFLCFKQSL